jgi:RNA polymerase sigma factor for flagellar operon FliA
MSRPTRIAARTAATRTAVAAVATVVRAAAQAAAAAAPAARRATRTPAPPAATPVPAERPVVNDELVRRFQPTIRRIAFRLAARLPPNVLVDDLMAAGMLGLVQAARKFDPSRGIPFEGYAEFRIRGAMLDELRAMDWIPRAHRDRVERLERAQADAQQKNGRTVETEEVAAELGVTVEEYVEARVKNPHLTVVSLDELSAGGSVAGDLTGLWGEPSATAAGDESDATSLRALLAEAMEELPPRLRQVASLYYYDGQSLKDIGAAESVTESRACQLRGEAVRRLRTRMTRASEGAAAMM